MVSSIDREQANKNNYDDLLVSIEANNNQLNLLIAVCDSDRIKNKIIQQYEQELDPNLLKYKIKLSPQKPSLSRAINQLIEEQTDLKNGSNAVITVTGTEEFRFLFKGENKQQSPQEELLGYFQWTREAFRHFPYSIIIWVTTYLQQKIEQKSPDFWSWRKGVFRFECPGKNVVNISDLQPHLAFFVPEINKNSSSLLPLEDLQELIIKIEQKQGTKTPQLANLYGDLGQVYLERSQQGESIDYQAEQNLAIEYLQKAIELQKELNLEIELANSLNNLAALYYFQGKYEQAEPLFLQALELNKQLLGEQHPDTANSLNNLAALYTSQGKYEQAEPLVLQALELRKQLLGEQHLDTANSLNNLAVLYMYQKKYEQAESLLLQALELRKQLLGEQHPDVAFNLKDLALLYKSQEKYEAAVFLFLQALEIAKATLRENHPDTQKIRQDFLSTSIMGLLEILETELKQIISSEIFKI